jgi:hypothetical protein
MRDALDADKVHALLRALGEGATGPGRVYLTGGTSAVLVGWRASTVDADLKLDPEPAGVFDAIRRAKDALHVNVELASPDDFLPPLPGWRERSRWIAAVGPVDFFHYDFHAQALSKIARGLDRDLADAREMIRRDLVDADRLQELFVAIEPHVVRYPALDAAVLRQKVVAFLASVGGDRG